MIKKEQEKNLAIRYRKQGLSYSEILKLVPVAKSTLSVWLKDVGLAKKQKQRLTEKRKQAQVKAQQACREKRIKITEEIKTAAEREIETISKRELWLIGIALYWAEGTKQKETNPSQKVRFSNSDPSMIKISFRWFCEICKIPLRDINFEIYIHKTADIENAKRYWAQVLNLPEEKFQKIRLKKHKINTKRKNVGENYHGLLAMTVRRSTNFNRKIAGWIEGIYKNCGVV